jgi:beta-lactamase regulating signal transducer with metallopeptidase domain
MQTFWEIVASNALLVVILAAGVAVVGRVWKNPACLHLLWVLVLLKLVTPPMLTIPIAMPASRAPSALAEERAATGHVASPPHVAASGPETAVVAVASEPRRLGKDRVDSERAARDVAVAPMVPRQPATPAISWLAVLGWTWAAGIVVVASGRAYRIMRLKSLFDSSETPSTAVLDTAEGVAKRLGLRRLPEVRMLPVCISPLVWWVGGRPKMFLPLPLFERLDGAAQETIIAHELAHVRRKDHWVRLLELAVTTLFWWHPVVWWAARQVQELEDQCCDCVVVALAPQAVWSYATALLDTLDFLSQRPAVVPLGATAAKSSHCLARRIAMLRNHAPMVRLTPGRMVLLAAAVAVPMTVAFAAKPREDNLQKQTEDRKSAEKAVVVKRVVNKRVKDFPEKTDLSTPESAAAALCRVDFGADPRQWLDLSAWKYEQRDVEEIQERSRFQKDKITALNDAYHSAEIVEVLSYRDGLAEVISRLSPPQGAGRNPYSARSFVRISGSWKNFGENRLASVEEAEKDFDRCKDDLWDRYVKVLDGIKKGKPVTLNPNAEAIELRDHRPAIANPAAHLKLFVDFLKREGKDPREFVLDAVKEHRLVILSELHHRPRYWALAAEVVRSPEFARRVSVVYMELPSNDQPLVDRFLAADKYDPEPVIEMLRDNLWTGWPDQPMLDFFRTVWEVNRELPLKERLRIVIVDMARPWKDIRKREDWQKYDVDRDQFMADNIVRDLEKHSSDPRHALFIVGYGHAMVDLTWGGGDPMKSAGWHLREKLGAADVFAIFPHGPVITNMGRVSGRLALGLFDAAFAALENKTVAFPLDHGPFGEQLFDADPERPTADPYRKGYHAYLYLGPLENEIFSPLIPGFYTDQFVLELDRRSRMMEGRGLVECGWVRQLTGDQFTAWMSDAWGQPRRWSAKQLGPIEAWQFGSNYSDAMRKRLPTIQAKTGKVLEVYGAGPGRKSLVNLTDGTVLAPDPKRFGGDGPEGRAWLKKQGIDLIAYAKTDSGDTGLAGYDMTVAKIDNRQFDTTDLDAAKQALEKATKGSKRLPAVLMGIESGVPVTYAFRTRNGTFGVLQIEDARLSTTPAVFRLRYKVFAKP